MIGICGLCGRGENLVSCSESPNGAACGACLIKILERGGKMERQPWDEFFFNVAELMATRSTCLRRQYGAVLVRDNTIIATGFNGAPRGCAHCVDIGCAREGMESGTRLELCRATHAEQNCIVNAARQGLVTVGAELYIWPGDVPCPACARILINAGIRTVHCTKFDYPGWEFSQQLFEEADVLVDIDDTKE